MIWILLVSRWQIYFKIQCKGIAISRKGRGIVTEPGFVYIYLSSDSPVPKEVYFDEFNADYAHSATLKG